MFVPRRPLLRGAMLGGAGFLAGRNAARRSAQEEEQEARLAELEARRQAAPPQAAPAPAAPAPSSSPDLVSKLQQLSELKDKGVLSADEFEAAKQKLLTG